METWVDIKGYEGRYQVSDLGRIKSLPNYCRSTELVMKQQANKKSGHMMINLTSSESGKWKQKTFYVHLLVLKTFVGPCPEGMEGCHNNGKPENNELSNLRWDTPKGNQADRVLHGTDNTGSRNPSAKLNEAQVKQIKVRLRAGEREGSISTDYFVTAAAIKRIRLNQTWSHVA